MATDKKKSSGTVNPLKMLRRLLLKLGPLLVIGFLVLLVLKPELIPNPEAQAKVMDMKESFLNDSPIGEKVGWLASKATEKFLLFAKNTKLPKQVTGLPEEVVVEDMVNELGQTLKDLPANQVEKIKANFCADVVNNASVAGEKDSQE